MLKVDPRIRSMQLDMVIHSWSSYTVQKIRAFRPFI